MTLTERLEWMEKPAAERHQLHKANITKRIEEWESTGKNKRLAQEEKKFYLKYGFGKEKVSV